MTIRQAMMPNDREIVHDLFSEYLAWACARLYEDYRVVFDRDRIVADDMETIDKFLPPDGLLLLAFEHDVPAGCACTRTIGQAVAEMKRMYVRPDFRRRGIGSKLVAETIRRVRQMNYAEMKLDSAGFMSDAHGVYRSAGFEETAPYEESEIPREHWEHWVFMKLSLK